MKRVVSPLLCWVLIVGATGFLVAVAAERIRDGSPGGDIAERPLYSGAPNLELTKISEFFEPDLLNAAQGIRAYGPDDKHPNGLLPLASGYLGGAEIYDLDLKRIRSRPYTTGDGRLTLFADVVRLADGRFAYTDFRGNRIVVLSPEGREVAQWGGDVLKLPIGIDQFSDGTIVVADYGNDLLRVFSPKGELMETIATPGGERIRNPYDLRIRKDQVILVDRTEHRILVLDRNFSLVRIIDKARDGTFLFNHPQHIDFDSKGRLYVMDTRTDSIKVIDVTKGVLLARLVHPDIYLDRGIAIDHEDRIYVSGFRSADRNKGGELTESDAGIMVFGAIDSDRIDRADSR